MIPRFPSRFSRNLGTILPYLRDHEGHERFAGGVRVTTRDWEHWQDTDFDAIGAEGSRMRADPSRNRARRRANKLRLIRLGLGSAALIVLLTVAAIDREGGTAPPAPASLDLRVEAPTLRTPPALWQPHDAKEITVAAMPDALAGFPVEHRAERHSQGGARDTFRFGSFDSRAPYLHLVVTRDSPEAVAHSFFVATALHAAEEGLAIHRIQSEEGLMSSRMALITAGITLEDGNQRSCIAFRGETGARTTVLSGWYCAAASKPRDLACLIDKLEIVASETRAPLVPGSANHASDCILDPDAEAPATEMPASRPTAQDIAGLLAVLEAEADKHDVAEPVDGAGTGPVPTPPARQR
jgi:hypothetical protein